MNTPSEPSSFRDKKCLKCGKHFGRRNCSQLACFACCDDENCEVHSDRRSILEGKNWINKLASEKRSLAILPGSFRETSFHYLGETAYLWSLKDFFANPKWRDDAIRRSKRNKEYYYDDHTKNQSSRTRKQPNNHHHKPLLGNESSSPITTTTTQNQPPSNETKKRKQPDSLNTTTTTTTTTPRGNRRQRFKCIMDHLFQQSLSKQTTI